MDMSVSLPCLSVLHTSCHIVLHPGTWWTHSDTLVCCCCAVTFSHKRNKKLQGVNLQFKQVFWPEEKRWIRLRISTKVSRCSVCEREDCIRKGLHKSARSYIKSGLLQYRDACLLVRHI